MRISDCSSDVFSSDLVGGKLFQIQRSLHPASVDMQLRDTLVVAREHGGEVFREIETIGFRQRADDAEVERDETRIVDLAGVDPDIAGVGVGMANIVAKNLGVTQAQAICCSTVRVDRKRVGWEAGW